MIEDSPRFAAAGIRVVVIGNGRVEQARAFAGAHMGRLPLYTDPGLTSYEALGAKRSILSAVSPSVFKRAKEAGKKGFQQTTTQGSALQQGGVLGVAKDGTIWFKQISDHAGDHFRTADVLAAHAKRSPSLAPQHLGGPRL